MRDFFFLGYNINVTICYKYFFKKRRENKNVEEVETWRVERGG